MLIDSHCHLDFEEFDKDRENVLMRARESGVNGMQTICTKLSEFEKVWDIANSYPGIWCSVGVHPHNVEKESSIKASDIAKLASRNHVIGIGETGLDFYYNYGPEDLQAKSFRCHLEVARQMKLPVIVHTRNAEEMTCKILEEEAEKGLLTGVIHCFTSTSDMAKCALDLGFYISFSGIITFKNASAIRKVCEEVPTERILIETDAPFLAPVPNRGKRNEPAFVVDTLTVVSEIKNTTVEEMAKITTDNFFNLFTKALIQDIDNK